LTDRLVPLTGQLVLWLAVVLIPWLEWVAVQPQEVDYVQRDLSPLGIQHLPEVASWLHL